MESRGSSDQEDEEIVQVREALMCLNGKNFEGLRTARFLKYTTTSIDDEVFDLPLDAFACRPESIDPEKWMAKILFPGWGSPSVNWVEWVNAMAESHATVWRKSGVHDAILASRYQIKKKDDLMMALVEKWCIETNTFVFPWGEATVTLEDMIVLGGFSVIGNNAMAPSKREDVKKVEDKMKKVKCEIEADSGKKCCVSSWMKEMMKSGSEIEHEAFMVSWLSRFVFPNSADLLKDMLFPAAIQLAKGVKLALAPAVLAGIYRDLGLLKEHLAGYSEKDTVVVKSPLQFVQVWAYERIMELQPPGQPSQLDPGEPRMARWHQHGGGQDPYGYPENVRAVLESVKESFDFRPYTKPLNNFKFPRFYLEDNSWVHVDKNILAFARCLRFSKLVGLDCIEPYYPHRVALQFGYDQDVPGVVPARTKTPELAWKDYIRPISGDMLYIPTRLHDGDVTVGYIRWWKLSIAILQSEAKKISHKLLASSPKQKPVDAITTKVTSFPPGEKAEEKDQEVVKKKKSKTKKVTCVTGSENKVEGRSRGSSSSTGSVTVSEQAIKHSLKKLEWVKRSPPRSTKSTEISSSSAPDLKGVLRGSGGTKGNGHVTFQLPGSSLRKSPSTKNMLLAKQSDSPIKKPRMLPRVADIAKQSSSSSRVPLPDKRDKYIKNISSSSPSFSGPSKRNKSPRSLEIFNSLSLQGSKESSCKSPSVSGSSSLTRNRLPRSLEAVNSSGNNNYPSPRVSKLNKSASSFDSLSLSRKKSARSSKNVNSSSRDNSVVKRNTDICTIASKQETPRKAGELGKATNLKFLEEIGTLREHVGEGGEVTYHIPKQQFEDLSQGVQDVLHDLHSIKYALNIQDDDDDE